MARKNAAENRARILQVAGELFYQYGIRAVGMDQIIRTAGVGNATVYRQFHTKDELAAAYVQDRADAWLSRMRAATAEVTDPYDKILMIFSSTVADAAEPEFRGCPMLNTHTEFPEPDHPAHAVAVAHKRLVRDWLRELAEQAGTDDPDAVADQLALIFNGVLATFAVLGSDGFAEHGLALAKQVVDAAGGTRQSIER